MKLILGKYLRQNGPVTVDLPRLLETRCLVQANSGQGKSWLLRRLLEITAGKVQQLIIDPEGEFSSLRERYDLIICAAHGADAIAHPKTAALLAHKLLEVEASAVLDISDLKAIDRHAFVRIFSDALIEAPKSLRHPVLVVVDEAQVYAPEKGQGESEASGSIIDLATRGRKRGLCLVAATQRISMLHKGVAGELKNRMIGGTSLDTDVKRAAFDLGMTPREALPILRSLKAGQFYVYGPALHQLEPELMQTGEVETTHPKVGQRVWKAPPKPTKAILAVLPKLADLPKEAAEQAKSLDDLKKALADTRRELLAAKRPLQVTEIRSPEDLLKAEKKGFEKGYNSATRVHTKVTRDALKELANAMGHQVRELLESSLEQVRDVPAPEQPPSRATSVNTVPRGTLPRRPVVTPEEQADLNHMARKEGLGTAHRKILSVLAQFRDGCDIAKLAILTRYSATGGFKNRLGELRAEGLIEGGNTEVMRITEAGLEKGPFQELPSDMLSYWLNHRSFGVAHRKIIQTLADQPGGMDIETLANATEYSATGGFKNRLGELRAAGVLIGKNTETMKLSPEILN